MLIQGELMWCRAITIIGFKRWDFEDASGSEDEYATVTVILLVKNADCHGQCL